MIEAPDADVAAGMEVYATEQPPCWAAIKRSPEDFRVEEVLGEIHVSNDPTRGSVPLYRVEKRLVDTLHLDRELSDALRSRVAFAGLKDKRALAVQYVTPTTSRARNPQSIEGERFRAELIGYLSRPLTGGSIRGNRFRIVLRDACPGVGERIRETFTLAEARRLPNYFGLQRFGGAGALTHRIGRAIVGGDCKEAVMTLLCAPRAHESSDSREAREYFTKGEFGEGSKRLPRGQDVERFAAERLSKRPEDYVGALRAVPIRLRRLYTHAFQSFLFNRALSLALRQGLDISTLMPGDNWGDVTADGLAVIKVHGTKETPKEGSVPLFQLPGYAYRNYGSRFDRCLEEVVDEEGVSAKQFFVDELQEVSVEGGFRRPHMVVQGQSFREENGDATLDFTLARGQYATVFVREVVKPQDPPGQGFA